MLARQPRKIVKRTRGRPAKRVSVDDFRNDPMFPRIERVVADLLAKGKVVAPVDVLVGMGMLRPEHLDDWRRGRVPYLERVINGSLSRLSRLLRILRFHVHDLNLKPSTTVYNRWGKGPKRRLRFSKTGDAGVEAAYARHFIWPGKGPFHAPRPKSVPPNQVLAGADGDMHLGSADIDAEPSWPSEPGSSRSATPGSVTRITPQ